MLRPSAAQETAPCYAAFNNKKISDGSGEPPLMI
jgi:hypothetical protein